MVTENLKITRKKSWEDAEFEQLKTGTNPVNYVYTGNAVYRIVVLYRFWFASQSVSFSRSFIVLLLRSNQVKW